MRQKLVKRYYCDHCSKGGLKKPSMRMHEQGCTRNPNRVCYLCDQSHDYKALCAEAKALSSVAATFCQPLVSSSPSGDLKRSKFAGTFSLRSARNINGAKEISQLSHMVDGCPACLLAVLRQSNVMAFKHFDYKKEVVEWYREQTSHIGR